MSHLSFSLLLAASLLTACGDKAVQAGSDDTGVGWTDDSGSATGGGSGSGGDDGGSGDGPIDLADAPPQSFTAPVHGDSGSYMNDLVIDDTGTWTSAVTAGVLSIAAMDADNNRIQLTLWESVAVGDEVPILAIEETGGLPTDANLTYIESNVGGQADGGTLIVTAWQETDSPNIMLLTGTLDSGLITIPDDPTWVRELRDAELTAIRVAVY